MNKAIKEGNVETVKRLLKMGASPNSADPTDGRNPLTNACKFGHLEIAQVLIKAGAGVNRKDTQKDGYGKSISQEPLSAACDRDTEDHTSVASIVRLLIDSGADPFSAHEKGKDGPLHFAAKHGHIEVVSLLLEKGIDVNLKGSYGYTALHHAAYYGRSLDLVNVLLEGGAHVNAIVERSTTPLFKHISSGVENVEIARLLIDKGAELKEEGYGGALYWAARCGKRKIVEFLIDRGLDVNSRDYKNEEEAVMGAMKNKHYNIVKILLEHGADPDAEDYWDGNLLQQAADLGDQELVKIILEKQNEKKAKPKKTPKVAAKKSKKSNGALVKAAEKGNLAVIKLLHESGIDINEEFGDSGVIPLMKAAASGKIEVVKYLLEKGANITARDNKGNTAMLYAASKGENEINKILIDHGAHINEKNNLNWNALMQASFTGNYSTVKLLLELGSPTDEIDQEKGMTALSLAKHTGNAKVIELLQNSGAKERYIRQRKSDEPYFTITECDICTYLPPRVELTHAYSEEEIKGLETIFTERGGEYKTEIIDMIKKCINCGTYYHHYFYLDTEDPIGGLIPDCSHHILRYNLLWLHDLLRKLEKLNELAEAQTRYQPIIDSFVRLVNAKHDFMPYIQPYVVETLVDYFVAKDDWDQIKTLLLNSKDPAICVETIQDLLNVWGNEFREEKFPPFTHHRNFTKDIRQKLRPMLQEHRVEFIEIIKRHKIDTLLTIAKKFIENTTRQKMS